MNVIEILAAVMMLGGVTLSLIATIGLHRFPDVFARMHAATKPATLGLVLTLLGAVLVLGTTDDAVKLLLVVGFQFITVPIAGHMVGRAAYRAGSELSADTTIDELADALDPSIRRAAEEPSPYHGSDDAEGGA